MSHGTVTGLSHHVMITVTRLYDTEKIIKDSKINGII